MAWVATITVTFSDKPLDIIVDVHSLPHRVEILAVVIAKMGGHEEGKSATLLKATDHPIPWIRFPLSKARKTLMIKSVMPENSQ